MPTTAVPRLRGATGGPQGEPVTLDEAKANSNVTTTADDDLIYRLIQAATDYTEELLGRVLVQRTIDYKSDQFPMWDEWPITLPFPPLISIDSIQYYDSEDTLQTWSSDNYDVHVTPRYGGLVYPKRNTSWPSTRAFRDSVIITYQAGYDALSANNVNDRVPEPIRQAILMLVSHLYENREATTVGTNFFIQQAPMAYHALLAPFRVRPV